MRPSMTAGQRKVGANTSRKRTPGGPTASEAAFQKQIIHLAHLHGWSVAHFKTAPTPGNRGWATPVQADGKGWPDLVLVRERIVFAELKRENGRMRLEQIEWMLKLKNTGAETYVWRPSDLEQIQKVLK